MARPSKITLEALRDYAESPQPLKVVAFNHGMHEATLRAWAYRAGMERRGHGAPGRKRYV